MVCKKCGTEWPNNYHFCKKCGAPLELESIKTISKKSAIIFAVIVVAIILLIAAYAIASSMFSAKKVAENYFKAIVNNDYDKAYNCMQIDDSGLTSKKEFKNYITENIGDGKIVSYSVNEGNSNGLASFLDDDDDSTSLHTVYVAEYELSNGVTGSMDITLNKSITKKLLLFDNYTVSNSGMLGSLNCTVPTSAKLFIDGNDISKLTDPIQGDYGDTYEINEIFVGTHDIVVTSDLTEDYADSVEIYSNENTYSVDSSYLEFKESIKNDIIQQGEEDITTLLKAATSSQKLKEDNDLYDDFMDNIYSYYGPANDYDYEDISISGISNADIYSISSENAVVEINIEYTYSYDYWGEKETSDGSDSFYLTYSNEDGEWILSAISKYYY